jgi:hypothetical protein
MDLNSNHKIIAAGKDQVCAGRALFKGRHPTTKSLQTLWISKARLG